MHKKEKIIFKTIAKWGFAHKLTYLYARIQIT